MTLSSTTPMFLRSVMAAALAWSIAAQRLEPPNVPDNLSIDVDNRIVGGDEADPGDYPYYVDMWGCGGALIAPDIVLFAAHCGNTAQDMQLNIGAYLPRTEAYGSQTRFCDVWIADPDYTTGPANSDFALCKLDRPVDMLANNPNNKQVFLELNKDETLLESGDELWVMGTGHTTEGGERSETLRDVMVPYLTNEECNRNDRYQGYITDLMMCAGYPDGGGKDACQGDSGGPIVKREEQPDGSFVDTHVGVVSWGVGCARDRYPGVYARTSSRYDWIVDTMCETMGSVSDLCKDDDNDAEDDDDWKEELDDEFVCEKGDEHLFTVDVTTDKYGSETSWLLSEEGSGEWIKRRKFLVNYSYERVSMCLKSDTCYEWIVRDTYGDGMCTNSGGCGNYKLTLEGVRKYTGDGNFGQEDKYSFCTSTKTATPTKNPETDAPESDSDESEPNESSDSDEGEPPDSPTNPPDTSPPVPSCDDLDLEFTVSVATDNTVGQIGFAMYSLTEADIELDPLVLIHEGIGPDSMYTSPGPTCLADNTCYHFAIADDTDDLNSDVYYAGFLGNDEVFANGGPGFNGYGEAKFCTGSATLPDDNDIDDNDNDEDEEDSPKPSAYPIFITSSPTTNFPTQVPTKDPTVSPYPSAAPSDTPSEAPSEAPSDAPSMLPTHSPTVAPIEPIACVDDPKFAFKKKDKWDCGFYLRGKKANRIKKRCKKRWKRKFIHEWCEETCGFKAGVGTCEHLYPPNNKSGGGGGGRRKKKRQQKAAAAAEQLSTMSKLADDETKEQHISDNVFVSTTFDHARDNNNNNNRLLSFTSTTTTTTSGDAKFRKLIQNKTRRN